MFVQALDFSDDEQEKMAKQKLKAQRRPQQQKQEESDSGESLLITSNLIIINPVLYLTVQMMGAQSNSFFTIDISLTHSCFSRQRVLCQ